jgi:hypothetical protein
MATVGQIRRLSPTQRGILYPTDSECDFDYICSKRIIFRPLTFNVVWISLLDFSKGSKQPGFFEQSGLVHSKAIEIIRENIQQNPHHLLLRVLSKSNVMERDKPFWLANRFRPKPVSRNKLGGAIWVGQTLGQRPTPSRSRPGEIRRIYSDRLPSGLSVSNLY